MVKRITIENFDTGSEGANLTYMASNGRFEWVKGSAVAAYTLSANNSTFNENATITFTLNTTFTADGTKIPFTLALSNTDNQANDFVSTSGDISNATLTGNFVVSSGSNSVSLTLNEDSTTEGDETLTITLDNFPNISNVVTITDSSTAGGGVIGIMSTDNMYFYGGYDNNPGTPGSRNPNSPGRGYGNRITKIPLASDTSSTLSTAPTSHYRGYGQSLSDRSGGQGYVISGLNPGLSPGYRQDIFKHVYSSSTTSTVDSQISAEMGRYGGIAFNSNDGDGGASGLGVNPANPSPYGRQMYWLPFASATTQTFVNNHPYSNGLIAYCTNGAVSPSNDGYLLHGASPSVPGNINQYFKMNVTTGGTWSVVNPISPSYQGQQATTTQSAEAAYIFGGVHTDYSTPLAYPWGYKKEKMSFASDTVRNVSTLPTSWYGRLGAGGASSEAGYIAGGIRTPANPQTPLYPTGTFKFPFANETSITQNLPTGYIGYVSMTFAD